MTRCLNSGNVNDLVSMNVRCELNVNNSNIVITASGSNTHSDNVTCYTLNGVHVAFEVNVCAVRTFNDKETVSTNDEVVSAVLGSDEIVCITVPSIVNVYSVLADRKIGVSGDFGSYRLFSGYRRKEPTSTEVKLIIHNEEVTFIGCDNTCHGVIAIVEGCRKTKSESIFDYVDNTVLELNYKGYALLRLELISSVKISVDLNNGRKEPASTVVKVKFAIRIEVTLIGLDHTRHGVVGVIEGSGKSKTHSIFDNVDDTILELNYEGHALFRLELVGAVKEIVVINRLFGIGLNDFLRSDYNAEVKNGVNHFGADFIINRKILKHKSVSTVAKIYSLKCEVKIEVYTINSTVDISYINSKIITVIDENAIVIELMVTGDRLHEIRSIILRLRSDYNAEVKNGINHLRTGFPINRKILKHKSVSTVAKIYSLKCEVKIEVYTINSTVDISYINSKIIIKIDENAIVIELIVTGDRLHEIRSIILTLAADNELATENSINVLKTIVVVVICKSKSKSVNAFLNFSYFVSEVKVEVIAVNVNVVNTNGSVVEEVELIAIDGVEAVEAILKSVVRLDVLTFAIIIAAFTAFAAFAATDICRNLEYKIVCNISLSAEHRKVSEYCGVLACRNGVTSYINRILSSVSSNKLAYEETRCTKLICTILGDNNSSVSDICCKLFCRNEDYVVTKNNNGLIVNIGINYRLVVINSCKGSLRTKESTTVEGIFSNIVYKIEEKNSTVLISSTDNKLFATNYNVINAINRGPEIGRLSDSTKTIFINYYSVSVRAKVRINLTTPCANKVGNRLGLYAYKFNSEFNVGLNCKIADNALRNVKCETIFGFKTIKRINIRANLKESRLSCGRRNGVVTTASAIVHLVEYKILFFI